MTREAGGRAGPAGEVGRTGTVASGGSGGRGGAGGPGRTRAVGLAAGVAAALCFGSSGPAAKPMLAAGLGALDVLWLRVAGAALVLLPFALRHLGTARRNPGLLLAYGLFAIAGVQGFYFAAITTVPVAVALLIEFLGPVLMLGWIRFVRGRSVPRPAVFGMTLALVGLVFVVRIWTGLGFNALGLLLALGAALCQVTYFLLADRGGEVDPLALTSWGLLVGAVVVTVLARPWSTMRWDVLAGEVSYAGQQLPAIMAVAWIVLFSAVLSYLTGIVSIRFLSPPVAGSVAFLEPVVATLLAWSLLREHLGVEQLFGGALILAGAYLAQRAGSRSPEGRPVEESERSGT